MDTKGLSDFNLTACLFSQNKKNANRIAIMLVDVQGEKRTLTYQMLFDKVKQAASQVQCFNFPKHSVVGLQSDDVMEFLVFFLALNFLGLVPVPLIESLNQTELEFILQDCKATAFFCFRDKPIPFSKSLNCKTILRSRMADCKERAFSDEIILTKPEDPAFIFYTSGSSGVPKGVIHAQRVIFGRLPSLRNWLTLNENDIVMQTDNLCWTYSMFTGFLDPLFVGATAVIVKNSHASSLAENSIPPISWYKLIEACQVTVMASTPDIYHAMLSLAPPYRFKMPSLRQAGCAGAFLKETIQAAWLDQFSFSIFVALGMSEISTFISTGPKIPYRADSIGKIQVGRKVKILPMNENEEAPKVHERGMLAVHKTEPGLMLAYVGDAVDNPLHWRDDWFLTQDIVSFDEEDYIHYHGRADKIIKVGGGFRVSPVMIEEEIKKFPGVEEAACTTHYDTHTASDQLLVYLDCGSSDQCFIQSLYDHLQANLSDYEVPVYYYLVNALPTTNRGKLAREKLHSLSIIKKYQVLNGVAIEEITDGASGT